jgi:hypothetical protein
MASSLRFAKADRRVVSLAEEQVDRRPVRMELRNRVRYRLSADAVFAWEGARHNRFLGEGVTRDISITGAFIITPTCPPVGATVQLDVFLSPPVGTARRTVRIKTEAKVIRVDHTSASEGFAAASQDFTLLFNGSQRNTVSVSSYDRTRGEIASD